MSSNENDIIFSKHIETSIKTFNSSLPMYDNVLKTNLLVTIEYHNSPCDKELIFKLSDDYDPFNVYILKLKEDQFLSLKSNQGLLVDFASFPQKLVDLLDSCIEEQCKDDPKFRLKLTALGKESNTGACLDIIEANSFKYLTHLSLKLDLPDESSFRKYITTTFQSLKNENKKLEHRIEFLQMQLSERIKSINDLTASRKRDSEMIMERHQTALNELEKKYEDEKKRSLLLEKEVINGKHKIENLKCELSALELSERESREKLGALIGEREISQKLANETKRDIAKLNTSKELMEEKIATSMKTIEDLQEKLENEIQEKTKLKKDLTQQIKVNENKCSEVSRLKEDLCKANDIINKLEKKLQIALSKIDILNQLTSKQEKVVGAKESRVKKLEQDLKQCVIRIQKKESEQDNLKSEVEYLRTKYEESKAQIKTNENVIIWLNKQLSNLKTTDKTNGLNYEVKNRAHITELPRINMVGRNKDGIVLRGAKK